MKNKFIFLFFSISLAIAFLSVVSATTYLDSNTILNATGSNTTISFSVPIYVENISIEDSSITLDLIQCSNGANNLSSYFWDTPNTNIDSREFCALPFQDCSPTDRAGFNLILVLSAVAVLAFCSFYAYKGFIDGDIQVGNIILMAIGIITSLVLFVQSAQNLGGAC